MARKDPAAVSLGERGGRARTKQMTAAQRKALARKAAQARWAKQKPKVSLQSLDDASLQGLQGIKHQLEDEIRVLQHELEKVRRRIKEKQGAA